VNWFRRRRQQAEEDDGSYDELMFDSESWVFSLPDDAELCVYEKGRYVDRLPIHYRGAISLESMLWERYGAGDYTVMPYFDGRLHSGHRVPIGTHSERNTRDLLNMGHTAFSELSQSTGSLGPLGVAGQIYVACEAIDNGVRLDDSTMVDFVRMLHAMAEGLEAADLADPDATEDTGASEDGEGVDQDDDAT
jgi:hypothetical protein